MKAVKPQRPPGSRAGERTSGDRARIVYWVYKRGTLEMKAKFLRPLSALRSSVKSARRQRSTTGRRHITAQPPCTITISRPLAPAAPW